MKLRDLDCLIGFPILIMIDKKIYIYCDGRNMHRPWHLYISIKPAEEKKYAPDVFKEYRKIV